MATMFVFEDSKGRAACRSCGKPIDTSVSSSHFATCPDAGAWRRR